MHRFVVVLHPSSGIAVGQIEAIQEHAAHHGAAVLWPSSLAELTQHLERAASSGIRRILVGGGDGTLFRTVNAAAPFLPELEWGILPLGTGNDLARSLDIPLDDIEAAFELAATHPATPLDLVQVTGERSCYFLNAATGGFGAQVTASLTTEDKQLWGAFAYWFTATSRLGELQPFQLDLTIDDESTSVAAYGLTVANGRYIGGGFPVSGRSLLDDGLLDLVLVPVMGPVELMAAGMSYLVGWDASSGILVRTARRLRIHAEPRLPFSFDGEPCFAQDADLEVVPGAWQVVLGPDPATSSR